MLTPASTNRSAPFEVVTATRHDLADIAGFLVSVFGTNLPPRLLDLRFLEWKFFSERPDWAGARSYFVKQEQQLVAHVCVWPLTFVAGEKKIRSCHLIDWAASPAAPGAGSVIYQHLMQLGGTAIAVGGSEYAQRVLPRLKFRPHGSLEVFARVVRPWKQFRSRPRTSGWKDFARLARNTFWSLRSLPSDSDWSALSVARADSRLDSMQVALPLCCRTLKSADVVNYILECPAACCSLFYLLCGDRARGYFILSQLGGQCRIADLYVGSENERDWRAGCRIAARTAAESPQTCEIAAASSLPWLSRVLSEDGFRLRHVKPVMLFDPESQFENTPPGHIQMIDSDALFLGSHSDPFFT
ncbi:MAG TPA: hypothetical protein VLY24_22345 [Bryobacteraceae bacterium]|nr:hypothetical protein [Bryobacteraceae bacterium]